MRPLPEEAGGRAYCGLALRATDDSILRRTHHGTALCPGRSPRARHLYGGLGRGLSTGPVLLWRRAAGERILDSWESAASGTSCCRSRSCSSPFSPTEPRYRRPRPSPPGAGRWTLPWRSCAASNHPRSAGCRATGAWTWRPDPVSRSTRRARAGSISPAGSPVWAWSASRTATCAPPTSRWIPPSPGGTRSATNPWAPCPPPRGTARTAPACTGACSATPPTWTPWAWWAMVRSVCSRWARHR